MKILKNFWTWLLFDANQKALAVLFAVIAGGWAAYVHFFGYPKPEQHELIVGAVANPSPTPGNMTSIGSNGGIVANIVGNNNTIGDPNVSANIKGIVKTLTEQHHQRELSQYRQLSQDKDDTRSKDQRINELTDAVTALSKGQEISGSKDQIKQALSDLSQGNTQRAKELFAKTAEHSKENGLRAEKTAAAYRHLGALAFLDNTQEALKAYRRAYAINPGDARIVFHPFIKCLESDSDQPIRIDSNTANYDDVTATSIYTGNVVTVQGSIRVWSDKLVVYFVNGEAGKMVYSGNKDIKVTFKQKSSLNNEYIKGEALTVDYYPLKNILVLIGEATVQMGNLPYTSDIIEHDSKSCGEKLF